MLQEKYTESTMRAQQLHFLLSTVPSVIDILLALMIQYWLQQRVFKAFMMI